MSFLQIVECALMGIKVTSTHKSFFQTKDRGSPDLCAKDFSVKRYFSMRRFNSDDESKNVWNLIGSQISHNPFEMSHTFYVTWCLGMQISFSRKAKVLEGDLTVAKNLGVQYLLFAHHIVDDSVMSKERK